MSGCVYSDWCDVYLCSTPLQQGNSKNGAVNALSLLASSTRSVCGNSWEKHWLLVFDYGEDEVLVCDADMDHEGDLTGRTTWKKRTALQNYEHKKYLAKRNIPKERIYQLVRSMCDSGRYHLTDNNCQKWVQGLLQELEIDFPADELDARAVVNHYIQPAAIAGAVALGVGLLVSPPREPRNAMSHIGDEQQHQKRRAVKHCANTPWRIAVVGCAVILFTTGVFGTSGLFYVYFMEAFRVSREAASWPASTMAVTLNCSGLGIGFVENAMAVTIATSFLNHQSFAMGVKDGGRTLSVLIFPTIVSRFNSLYGIRQHSSTMWSVAHARNGAGVNAETATSEETYRY
ncbi:hypothetical protein HPB50_000353 [Hyalomma asiaticum]|uniref:Uncharacterized protein n=1 Tax=Hyalomma asiaticum TaxID=266040 RepID=A0ACB7SB21_HYAAI|nr:hypothetical protein HPB50_000353 [Hyalomma asiaticum]